MKTESVTFRVPGCGKDHAIEFGEWLISNYYTAHQIESDGIKNHWNDGSGDGFLTTAEAYDIFLKEMGGEGE